MNKTEKALLKVLTQRRKCIEKYRTVLEKQRAKRKTQKVKKAPKTPKEPKAPKRNKITAKMLESLEKI